MIAFREKITNFTSLTTPENEKHHFDGLNSPCGAINIFFSVYPDYYKLEVSVIISI